MRISAAGTILCIIDVQEKLLAALADGSRVVDRCFRLARAARLLDVATVLTEQYPRGLGSTPAELAASLPEPVSKLSFSCCGSAAFPGRSLEQTAAVVLAGLETHVCVAQTALDLLARGQTVFVAVDAVSSRHAIDHETALRRLESAGAWLTTSEAVIFEWLDTAEHPRFQDVRRLVR